MEVTKDFLDGLTPTDLDNIDAYQRLLRQVRNDINLLQRECLFRFGQNEFYFANEGRNAEWVSHDGTWHFKRGDSPEFIVKLDENIMFEFYKEYRCQKSCRANVKACLPVLLERIEKLRAPAPPTTSDGGITYTYDCEAAE